MPSYPASCQGWGGSNSLSNASLADLVRRHFPDGTVPQTGHNIRVTAYAIGRAESGGNPLACGDNNLSVGIWQIYTLAHPQYIPYFLFDPDYNAQVALDISGGIDFNAWCTWEPSACGGRGTSSYRTYLAEAEQALGQIPPPPPPPPPPARTSASALRVLNFKTIRGIITVNLAWHIGGPDQTMQRLDLTMYPLGFDVGINFPVPPKQSSVPITGLYPGGGYIWRIATIFSDGQELLSDRGTFIAPTLNVVPPTEWPYIPYEYRPTDNTTLYALLAAGVFTVGIIALALPRKKIIIKKKVKK